MATGTASRRSVLGGGGRSLRLFALVCALLVGGAVVSASALSFFGVTLVRAQDEATPIVDGDVGAAECPADLHGQGAESWGRSELYFGTSRPDDSVVTDEEWLAFLDAEVTPRFPDGLTVLTGLGQYRESEQIVQERSEVLIILYPTETAAESSALLEEIRDAYEQQFEQSSVLRADITDVCTSF